MRPTRLSFRPRWIVFGIVLVAGMLSLLDGVAHKDVTAYAGGGAPAEAQEAPAEEGGGEAAAADTGKGGGFYMHPLWLALVVISISVWLYTCSWIYDDALGVGMEPEKWTSIIVGSGLATVLAMFLLHAALGFLVLATVVGVFIGYVRVRNEQVPTLHKIFGPEHMDRMLGKFKFWSSGEKKHEVTTAGFPMMRQDGQTLEHLAMDEEGLEEAASITAELITRAIQVEGRSIRILPTNEGITAAMDLDGVMQNLDSFEPELGNAILRCVSWLWRGKPGNEQEDFKREFYAQSPEHGKLPVQARPVKTRRGSGVVLTLPDWTEEIHSKGLGGLGMSKKLVDKVETELNKKEGVVLTSGPEGSGTTTSLYALVEHIDIFVTEVLSIEEEIEFPLDQVIRKELNPEEGEDFEEIYTLALREEPDVIMFGELKDRQETATLLEFAAKDGMLLSCLKADTSSQAIARLISEFGINPAALASTLNCVTNQRLLRTLCESCKEEYEPSEQLLRKLKINPQRPGRWFKPVGCPNCFDTGYRGRTALFELLIVNDEVKTLLKKAADSGKKPSPQAIKKAAGSDFFSMQADGLRKVRKGITTLDEVRNCLGR